MGRSAEEVMMVCLDTDFLVALIRRDRDAEEYSRRIDSGLSVSTTPVNAFELFQGAYKSERAEENIALVEDLLSGLDILPFDLEASQEAGSIVAKLNRGGSMLDTRDALIGGIVRRHDETLLTRNVDHFSRIPGLRIEEW